MTIRNRCSRSFSFGLIVSALTVGCDPVDAPEEPGPVEVPEVYAFDSRFEPGTDSVSYSGQTFRQALVVSLVDEISRIGDELDAGTVFAEGEVAARLTFYYQFDSATGGTLPHAVGTTPAPMQTTWDDISSDKDLKGKIAGNDAEGQHRDWNGQLIGWAGAQSPEALVLQWIDEVDALAVARSSGTIATDPDGVQIEKFYVSPQGLDYRELLAKFLLGAVNYSQGTDDYLDDDLEGKGLRADHAAAEEGEPFTALEHAWDEAFGYWGGARDYLAYTDDEIADTGHHDSNGDGAIDLRSEICFGASVNAAKRDRGSAASAPTDFTASTMDAFLTGRAILASADGPLSDAQMEDLQAQRDLAVLGWEQAIAATAVHYINDMIQDTRAGEFDFVGYAQHFGELKGFLLSLQFNPRSQVGDADLRTIHDLVGVQPVVPSDPGAAAYVEGLLTARGILGTAYGFDPANLGDDAGENGW